MDKCVLGGNSIPQGAWTPLLEEKLNEAPLIVILEYVRLITKGSGQNPVLQGRWTSQKLLLSCHMQHELN